MVVTKETNSAEAIGVSAGSYYDLRVRFRTLAGGYSTYATVTNVQAVAIDNTPPSQVPPITGAGGAGEVEVRWLGANSQNYRGVNIYYNTTSSFGTATFASTQYGTPNDSQKSYKITGLSPGTYYVWATAINGSGVEASPPRQAGPFTVT
jgi:hypothetical protein